MQKPAMRAFLFATALTMTAAMPVVAAPAADVAVRVAPQDFDAYVDNARRQFDVPGIAVAIVKDGKVVLAKGYGVRDVQSGAPVTADTLFAIASNTKAFTAASLNMLADEGKLDMDDRVIDHLPWFQMSDAYITREMRIKDLLAHRSGLSLGAGDLLYWPTTSYSNREVAERLRHVPINGGFRAQYAYDNILFGVAQLVIEQASGEPYEKFLQMRIWDVLGMNATRYNSDHLQPNDEVATGYAKADGAKLEAAPRMTWSNVGGAGGIYSSVDDLGKWVSLQLNGGVVSGEGDNAKRLFSPKRQDEMWSVLTPIPVGKPSQPELAAVAPNYSGYGEGWFVSEYRGHKMLYHTGGWPGMVSRITLIPDEKLGVIVLTNAEVGAAFNAVTLRALDDALGAPRTDWTDVYAKAQAKSQGNADAERKKHAAARDAKSKPSLPLAAYAGTYRDAWYGDVTVGIENGRPVLKFSHTADLVGDMEPWQHDTFVVHWRQRWLNADAFVTFQLDEDGKPLAATMKPVSPLADFSFDFQDLKLKKVEVK